jgi:hypothetical protein
MARNEIAWAIGPGNGSSILEALKARNRKFTENAFSTISRFQR